MINYSNAPPSLTETASFRKLPVCRGCKVIGFRGHFLIIFVVFVSDRGQEVYYISPLLTGINSIWKSCHARETSNCSFPGITHISEKDFQILFAVNIGRVKSPHRALGNTHQYQ